MATNTRAMACSPDDVFRVLADGWLYPAWVVGASRVREVDPGWPAEGARLKHSFGSWPLLIDDTTSVIEWTAPERVRLQARGWPMGEAYVVIEVQSHRGGCLVRIVEDAAIGPSRLIPRVIRDLGMRVRNRETLRRLAYLVEGGAR